MSQSSFSISNISRTLFRTAVNTALQALASNNSGASEPTETYAHMWWPDTTSGWVKQRNAANSGWEKKFPIAKARVDVASSATLDLDANAVTSDYLRITGTTTVTAVTLAAGQRRIAVAGGAFQLTNSASLIVHGGANYTTTAGDLLLLLGESGGVVRIFVLKADGTPISGASNDMESISATQSSGALTIALNPCALSFRSATLTSGTPAVLRITSPITLTIAATDSFGLATANGTQRLAIIAVDNGTTMQLAASALYGGVALTEDNVLTTVAAATSATHVLSGSVVSNRPYRIVGYVDVQFTTGSGWGNPSLVQGIGGVAGAAMQSLGYGQTWQSTGRNRNTTFYNTTGKPIVFHIQVEAQSSSNVALFINVNGVQLNGTSPAGNTRASMSAVIPPYGSYSWGIQGDGGTTSATTYELR